MKENAMKRGAVNPVIKAEVNQILSTGYALPLTNATDRQRQSLNLKPVPMQAAAELAKIAAKTGLAKMLKETPS
jgi:hypothetical protein